MRKFKGLVLALVTFIFGICIVQAACETEESNKLNGLAVNVKASYEIVKKEVEMGENYNPPDGLTQEELDNYKAYRNFFKIYINNVTEELYVKVENKNTKEVKTYTYADVIDGAISFEEEVYLFITNYVITVYSSDKTNCGDTKLYTLYLTTPMYNPNSESVMCTGIEDFYLCHEYLTVNTSFENFEELTTKYREGKLNDDGTEVPGDNEKDGGITGFIKDHLVAVIITSVVIITIGGLVTVIIVKKQRSRIV